MGRREASILAGGPPPIASRVDSAWQADLRQLRIEPCGWSRVVHGSVVCEMKDVGRESGPGRRLPEVGLKDRESTGAPYAPRYCSLLPRAGMIPCFPIRNPKEYSEYS